MSVVKEVTEVGGQGGCRGRWSRRLQNTEVSGQGVYTDIDGQGGYIEVGGQGGYTEVGDQGV